MYRVAYLAACRKAMLPRVQQGSYLFTILPLLLVTLGLVCQAAAQGLQVSYGSKGVQTLSYNGVVLEDTRLFPSDTFYIGHLQCNDLQGATIVPAGCTWGESSSTKTWDPTTLTETYRFPWGSINTQFVQSGDSLDIVITESNLASSGLVFAGAELHPLALHFPKDPVNFNGYSQYAITTTGPAVTAADFGSGVVTNVLPDAADALYGGWKVIGPATYSPIAANVRPDNLANFYPTINTPVYPGSTFSFRISLRFTPAGTAANAQDAYAAYAGAYPSKMTWSDHRIIGSDYVATSPAGDPSKPAGFPTNPRRYFNDPSVNITTADGLRIFQQRMLAQAAANVTNAQALNAQGVMVFDIEGDQYPQPTTYVCSPDQIAGVAPEMESIIADATSPYNGQKLDDAYFRRLRDAGLKVGLCIRPQVFTVALDGTGSQVTLSTNAAIITNLEKKVRAANTRWGVTMFYVDSNVDIYGGTLDPAIYQQLISDFPGFLFIPEESTPRYFAYTAPFFTFIFKTELGTPGFIYNVYPQAFGVNRVNDVDPALLAQYKPQLIQQVAHGDILLGHTEYWQANNPTLLDIYAEAKNSSPALITPVLTWPTPAAITYGTPLSQGQLNASANVAGTFTYVPAAGQVLSAGTQTLNVTFVPADTANYRNATASVSLNIAKAAPVLTWAAPAAITQGTALSTTQLNAAANVPGSFAYSPGLGVVPNAGLLTLSATFTPSDTADYSTVTTSVPLTVNPATSQGPVTILSPTTGATVSGLISVTASIQARLDAAGSYLLVDGNSAGTNRVLNAPFAYALDTTTLSNGVHTLQVWAHDINNLTLISPGVSITVQNGSAPLAAVITWPAPAPITYGSPLTSAQLNATANIPGTFVYTPAAGTVLSAGNYALRVAFTPSDTTRYSTVAASVGLFVGKAAPVITWPAPAAISQGTPLSAAQLNATANVPGTFTYTPAAGTVLNVGSSALNLLFTPSDLADYTTAGATVSLTVTNGAAPAAGPVVILSPSTGAVVSGNVAVTAQINLTLDAAGSLLFVDGVPIDRTRTSGPPFTYLLNTSMLTNGAHVLQVWAHDISNTVTFSQSVTIVVQN